MKFRTTNRSIARAVVIAAALATMTLQSIFFKAAADDSVHPAEVEKTVEAPTDNRVVAVLFSVGRTENARKQFRDVPNLDLLEVNGLPMITYVYEALCQSAYVDKIIVVAAPEIRDAMPFKEKPTTSLVIDKGDAAENVQFGIDEISRNDLIMFIPSDLVLVTPQGLDSLIERVMAEKDVDIFFPIISREACEKKYPEEKRTYARFEEGHYTGAHVEFLRPGLFLDHANQIEAQKSNLYNVYYMRRNTLGIARFLGLKLTLKYIIGTLSPGDVEEHVSDKYNVTAKALYWDDPDLTTDLSEPDDIQMIQKALKQRGLARSQFRPTSMEPISEADTRTGARAPYDSKIEQGFRNMSLTRAGG